LRLDEKRKPQDGRFSAIVDKRRIDFRVSTFPTEYGEKVAMRISRSVGFYDDSGIRRIYGRKSCCSTRNDEVPYGIVLIAGPTGSGKSTTLLRCFPKLNREKLNVVSLEDPVEYEIPGVGTESVRPEIVYLANGLRPFYVRILT